MFGHGLIGWLQSYSSPSLDLFFETVTQLGNHYAYMLIIPFVYWAIDRDVGRRVAGLFMASMWANGLIKEYLILPRPDASLVRVLAHEPSPGFPSGHAQGAMALWGFLAASFKHRTFTILAVVLIGLISLSRLYMGVHFPGDVVGGLVISAALILAYFWLRRIQFGTKLSRAWRVMLALVLPLLLYPLYQTGTSEMLLGFFIGFFTAHPLMASTVPFQERVPLGRQLIRLIIGYAGFFILIALHILFVPAGLPAVFGYSLIGVWVAWGAPAVFHATGLADRPAPVASRRGLRLARRFYIATGLTAIFVLVSAAFVHQQTVPVATLPEAATKETLLSIGHRGATGLAPENTLLSFQTALEYGVDLLELDVWIMRDGNLAVIHDDTVDRTTDGSGSVEAMTIEDIQALDAAYSFTEDGGLTYPLRGTGIFVPTLDEVLQAFPTATLLIELKSADPAIADAALAVVDQASARRRVMFASFHDHVIQRMRLIAADIPTSYGQGEALRFVIMQRLGLAPFVRPVAGVLQLPEWQGSLRVINPGLVRAARQRGLQVHAWTINDRKSMQRLMDLGVDGIITDYPDRLAPMIEAADMERENQVFY